MSNQEMQFADPDWEPTRPGQQSSTYMPQPVNDRREPLQQPVVETPPAQEEVYSGYAGAQPEQLRQPPTYQYPQRPYRRRRNKAWLWIIVIVLFFSLSGGGVGALGSIGQKSVTESVPLTGPIAGTPTIVINDVNGNIRVDQGSSLSIQEVKKSGFFDDPNNINVKVDETGSTITLNVDEGGGFLSERSVDFTITVPGNANLQLKTTSGDISVDNADGTMNLQTTSGNITTANDTFVDSATLNTTSGDIQSTNDVFNSDATLSTTSGDVSMHQDTLNGSAKVNATSGDIDFTGTLASQTNPSASYQFTAISGDIHLGLSATANFSVQADTTSGSIDAGDFPSINVLDAHKGSGSDAEGSVGTPGGPSININTTSGDITIQQR